MHRLMEDQVDLAVLIVNWNVRDLLARCLCSLARSLAESDLSWQALVVDNASGDGSAEMLRGKFSHIRLLELPENRGFAGGVNAGLRALEAVNPRYLLLLNPDVEVVGPAIPHLVACLEAHPEVGVVGPQLRFPDGTPQSSRRRFPTFGTLFWESTPLELLWPGNPWARRYHLRDRPDDQEQEVDWLVGACLLARWEVFQQAGRWDEGFFLYFEETEWFRRVRRVGWRVHYLPAAQVVHHEGRSTAQVPLRRHLFFQKSKIRYTRQVWGPAAAGLLRLFLLTMAAWQWLLEGAKYLLGHKRPLRRERLHLYAAILRDL